MGYFFGRLPPTQKKSSCRLIGFRSKINVSHAPNRNDLPQLSSVPLEWFSYLRRVERANKRASTANREISGRRTLFVRMSGLLLSSFLSLFPTWQRCMNAHCVRTAPNAIKKLGCICSGCSCTMMIGFLKQSLKELSINARFSHRVKLTRGRWSLRRAG